MYIHTKYCDRNINLKKYEGEYIALLCAYTSLAFLKRIRVYMYTMQRDAACVCISNHTHALHFILKKFHIQISFSRFLSRPSYTILSRFSNIIILCLCICICCRGYRRIRMHARLCKLIVVDAKPSVAVVLDSRGFSPGLRHFVHTFTHATRHLSNIR